VVAAGSITLGVNTGVSAVRNLRSSRPDGMSGEECERITMETLENVKFGEINNEQTSSSARPLPTVSLVELGE
jgi:hypothetical protein